MKRTSAEKAAELTGQPLEIYLDDARAEERMAGVSEVPSIEYPVDANMVRDSMDSQGKEILVLTDGANTHLFRRTADGVTEISSARPNDRAGRDQLERILKVYRRNRREGARSTDILKGLLLFSKRLEPRNEEEAMEMLRRLGKESGVYMREFNDWESVAFALESLRNQHIESPPGDLAMAFLNTMTDSWDLIPGSERVGRIAASFVEDDTSASIFLNPFVAASLPYGSIKGASCTKDELTGLVAMLMGAEGILQSGNFPPIPKTVVCSMTGGNTNTEADVLDRALDALPEGGRLIAIEVTGILFSLRSEDFRRRVNKDFALTAVIRVVRGFMPASSCDASILVIDRREPVAPTEYAVVPEVANPVGNWRTWSGVTFTECLTDYGTDWIRGFDRQCSVEPRDGPKLRDVADIRKGSIIRSDDLFPSDSGTGIPFLKVRDVSAQGMDLESAKRASGKVTVVARPGDILVPCNGMTDRIYRLRSYDPVVAPSYSLAIVTADRSRMLPEFLELFFRTEDFREQADALMTGNMTRTLSKESLSRVIVPDMDIETQTDIVDRYRDMLDLEEHPDPDALIFGEEDDARGRIHRQDRGGSCGAAEDGAVPGGAGGREGRDQSRRDRGDLLVLGPFEGRVRSGRFGDVEDLRVPSVR